MPTYRVTERVTYEIEAHCEGCARDGWIQEEQHTEVGWDHRDIELWEGDEPSDSCDSTEDF